MGLPGSSKSATGKAARIASLRQARYFFPQNELVLGLKFWEFWLGPFHEVLRAGLRKRKAPPARDSNVRRRSLASAPANRTVGAIHLNFRQPPPIDLSTRGAGGGDGSWPFWTARRQPIYASSVESAPFPLG